MTIPIQQYNDGLPDDLKAQVLTQNTDALNKLSIGRGVNLLASVSSTTQQTVSAGTTTITALTSSFTASGGLIEIVANLAFLQSQSQTAKFSLWIDGTQKTQKTFSASVGLAGEAVLTWKEKMGQGSHRVEVKVSIDGGGLSTPLAIYGDTNNLFITEIIL